MPNPLNDLKEGEQIFLFSLFIALVVVACYVMITASPPEIEYISARGVLVGVSGDTPKGPGRRSVLILLGSLALMLLSFPFLDKEK